jgi:hypothetical protein
LSFDTTKVGTKKGRRKKSVAQWQFLGVFMGVLAENAVPWEFLGVSMGVFWGHLFFEYPL